MGSRIQKVKDGLFNLDSNNDITPPQEAKVKKTDLTYNEHGFEQAKNQGGSSTALKIELNKIYQGYKEELRQNKQEQEELKRPYKVKLGGLKSENEELEKKITEIEEVQKPDLDGRIEAIGKEIRYIKENPESIIGDRISKASFVIGLTIIAFLTIYLIIFYSSASYSAFFKEFTQTNLGVVNSIFDPQAFTKAFQDGFTELILISAMPFVFLGLGYLIHKFQEQESLFKYFKIAMLLLVTFVFDSILAFEITNKIYDIEAANSFQAMPAYTVASAFENVQFWLIIFAGFVVYIIWGFVFDFVMEAYDKIDQVGLAIRNKQEEITGLKQRKEILDKTIFKSKETISSNKTHINKLQEILTSYVIQPKKFEKIYTEFLVGWVHCLTALKHGDDRIKEAEETGKQFISSIMDDYIIGGTEDI